MFVELNSFSVSLSVGGGCALCFARQPFGLLGQFLEAIFQLPYQLIQSLGGGGMPKQLRPYRVDLVFTVCDDCQFPRVRIFSFAQHRNRLIILSSKLGINRAQPFQFGINVDHPRAQRLDFFLNFRPSIAETLNLRLLIDAFAQPPITLQRRVSGRRTHLGQLILERPGIVSCGATTLFALRQFSREPPLLFCSPVQLRLGLFEQAGETAILRDVNVAQQFAQLFAHNTITSRLRCLPAKAVHLPLNFRNDVRDATEISACRFETGFGGPLAHAKLGNAGCLFNDGAAVHRLG